MEFKLIKQILEEELRSILGFWVSKTQDNENGGFYGSMDYKAVPDKTADKGIILNARILWTFSKAYNYEPRKEYLEMADRAYMYIKSFFFDKINGGVYWKLDAMGKPADRKKQIYAQAFIIYALSEFYKIRKNPEVLKDAFEIYELIEKYSFDKIKNGYFEAFSENWGFLEDVRLSEKEENQVKTMNTHLHVLEAYTSLYYVYPDDKLRKSLGQLVDLFRVRIFNSGNFHLNLFFNESWQVVKKMVSYGHDIEASWLLWEAAEAFGDQKVKEEILPVSIKLVNAAKEGIDTDGGLIYEFFTGQNKYDFDKHWWPQAEAMVGFLNAYQLTKEKQYLKLFFDSYTFTIKHMPDREYGEWHWKVNREGIPYKEEKVGFWKCPYHNTRACIEVLDRINKL